MNERTVARIWADAVSATRAHPAYLVEEEPGRWAPVSWAEAEGKSESSAMVASLR